MKQISSLTQLSDRSIVDWNQFCRDICADFFHFNPIILGGSGVIVQLDESVFSKRKYHVGRAKKEMWIFGAYEPSTGRGFMVPVEKRDSKTLIPIIARHILLGYYLD